MIPLSEMQLPLMGVLNSRIFVGLFPGYRNHEDGPSPCGEDTVKLRYGLPVVFHMLQYMRTKDNVEGLRWVADVGDVHLLDGRCGPEVGRRVRDVRKGAKLPGQAGLRGDMQ